MRTLVLAAVAALSFTSCQSGVFVPLQERSATEEIPIDMPISDPVVVDEPQENRRKESPFMRVALIGGVGTGHAESEEILNTTGELDFDGGLVGLELGFHVKDTIEIGARLIRESGEFDLSVTGGGYSFNFGNDIDYERTQIDAFVRGYTSDSWARGFIQTSIGGGNIDFVEGTAKENTLQLGLGLGLSLESESGFGFQAMAEGQFTFWQLQDTPYDDINFTQLDGRLIVGLFMRF